MSDTTVTFKISKVEKTVSYEKGDSILDCAIKADLNPPYSCMEGVCTACLAKVEFGEVDFPDDTVLDPDEFKRGFILSCQAKAKANCTKLVINYDSV